MPTAVLCANDLAAIGVLRALRRHDIAVPGRMAVVGYDDITVAAELMVPLTSVRQPTHELGRQAADMLLRRHADPGAPTEQVQFRPQLVVRRSSDPTA